MTMAHGPALPVLAVIACLAACTEAQLADAVPDADAEHPDEAPVATASPASTAARTFLATLDDGTRADATFDFDDDERRDWTYLPGGRGGVPLRDLDAAQRAPALALVDAGLSAHGARLARGVLRLEGTLRDLERAGGSWMAFQRDPDRYVLAVFGTPGGASPWGWRFEGHHLSINVTDLGPQGQVVAPLFVGANPARVPSGAQAGQRLLAAEEDLAFELLHMLDTAQRARAVIDTRSPGDIVTGDDPAVRPIALAGLPASEMSAAQQGQLRRLLELYARRMADAPAAAQLQRIDDAGFGRLHFAWAGAQQPRAPHYYRIHGPTVLVEYDNSQDGGNHIHTVWRDLQNDFGGDLLRRHYAAAPHRHRAGSTDFAERGDALRVDAQRPPAPTPDLRHRSEAARVPAAACRPRDHACVVGRS